MLNGHPVYSGTVSDTLQSVPLLGPEIILVRGCENVAGKLRQKW